MSLPETLHDALAAERLFVAGEVREGGARILLLSPDEPGFWAHVTAEPEFADGAPDPLDRWSGRVIGALAKALGGRAILPSDGPPYPPFYSWALASGQAFASPILMLVHRRMGLLTSFRGALALPADPTAAPADTAAAAPATPHPCDGCAAPCTRACPCGALGAQGYDTAACHAFLNAPEGQSCLLAGCLARRSCPLGESYGRLEEQSAWHMRQFHK